MQCFFSREFEVAQLYLTFLTNGSLLVWQIAVLQKKETCVLFVVKRIRKDTLIVHGNPTTHELIYATGLGQVNNRFINGLSFAFHDKD